MPSALFLDWAECEYLCGAFDRAEDLFEVLLGHAESDLDRASVYKLRLQVYQVAGKYDDAVAMAAKALRLFGVEIPSDDQALNRETEAEAAAVKGNFGGRRIAKLAEAQEAADPRIKALIGLLSDTAPAAYIGSRPQIYPLIALKSVNLSLRHGPTKGSCHGYSAYGLMLTSRFDDPHGGYAFSELGIKLSERFSDLSLGGISLFLHGNMINFWLNPIATDFPVLERGFSISPGNTPASPWAAGTRPYTRRYACNSSF
jgi:predicted ATPase